MATKVFDIQEVLKSSWENFKKAPVLLIGLLLLSTVASLIVMQLSFFLHSMITSIISGAVTSYIMLSIIRAVLTLLNGEIPGWGLLKNDFSLYLKFFIMSILLSIIFIIASILFIIPLVLALTIFFPATYILVDKKDIGIFEAFKRSWEITTPQFVSCLIFIIVCFVLVLIGMIPLGLGMLIVVPIIYISGGIIYKKLDAVDYSAPAETEDVKE
ncbi:MAG: hypothetical protein LBD46_08185 [Endomicrobium sp.]|jgi:hypothetical protein|nr:hypothetical protein [Endomicrobium sp.]